MNVNITRLNPINPKGEKNASNIVIAYLEEMQVRTNRNFILFWCSSSTFKVPSSMSHWLPVQFRPWSTSIAFVNKDAVISKRLPRVATFPFKGTIRCAFNCRCPKSLHTISLPPLPQVHWLITLDFITTGSSLKQEASQIFIWMVPGTHFQAVRSKL